MKYFQLFPINIIEAVLSFILGFLLYLLTDSIKKPNLQIVTSDPSDLKLPTGEFRILNLKIINKKKNGILEYFNQTATQVRAKLIFRDYLSKAEMIRIVARWNTTREPLTPDYKTIDVGSALTSPKEVLSPGEEATISVVIRENKDSDCYPFNNESYLFNKFKKPEWKIKDDKFVVDVLIQSGEIEKPTEKFLVINKGDLKQFNITKI